MRWKRPKIRHFLASLIVLIALAVAVTPARANKNPDFFLKTGQGARALGLGGAFTAVCDDSTSAYWNPAGLAQLANIEIHSMHSDSYNFEIIYDTLNLAIPVLPGRTLGLSAIQLKTEDIPITKDKDPSIKGYTRDLEIAKIISYGHKISRDACLGANFKLIEQEVYGMSSEGMEADFGILYKPSRYVNFGVNVQDALPSKILWNTGIEDEIPVTIRGGMALHVPDWGTLIAVDMDKVVHRPIKWNGGFEYQFNHAFTGRIGWNDGDPSVGCSITYKGTRFDYAYLRSDLGDTIRLSTAFRFGHSLFEKVSWPRNVKRCHGNMPGEPQKPPVVPCNVDPKTVQSVVPVNSGGPSICSLVDDCSTQPDIRKIMNRENNPVAMTPVEASVEDLIAAGNKQLLKGDYEDAINSFKEAIRLQPSNEKAHLKLAGIYQYMKLYDDAIEEYKDAIQINPRNLDNYIGIANLYAATGEYEKACEACEIVFKTSPDSIKAKVARNLYEAYRQKSSAKAVASARGRNAVGSASTAMKNIIEEDPDLHEIIVTPKGTTNKSSSRSTGKKSNPSSKKAKTETYLVSEEEYEGLPLEIASDEDDNYSEENEKPASRKNNKKNNQKTTTKVMKATAKPNKEKRDASSLQIKKSPASFENYEELSTITESGPGQKNQAGLPFDIEALIESPANI